VATGPASAAGEEEAVFCFMAVVVGWVVSGAVFDSGFGCKEAVVNVMDLINGTVRMRLSIRHTVLVG
jgi:hypothetical protein